jgi:hypothetical protein
MVSRIENFPTREYEWRVEETRREMERRGIDCHRPVEHVLGHRL